MRVALVVCLALAIVAPACAQGPTDATFEIAGVDLPPDRLVPDKVAVAMDIPWVYTVPPSGAGSSVTTGSVTLAWGFECADTNVIIAGSRTDVIVLQPATLRYPGNTTFRVSVTQEAQGIEPIPCTVSATVTGVSPTTAAVGPVIRAFNVTAEYFGLVMVVAPNTVKQAEPGHDMTFALTITNLGNAPSMPRFSLLEDTGAWTVQLPANLTLARDESADVSLTVHAPGGDGWNNKQKTIRLQVSPVSADEPAKAGQPVSVSLVARTRGFGDGKGVPGLDAWLPMAVLAAALLARRR